MRIYAQYLWRRFVFLAMLVVTVGCAVPAAATPSVLDLTALKVIVSLERAGLVSELEAQVPTPVEENDRIAVAEAGRALLRFTNDIVVELFRQTDTLVQEAYFDTSGSFFIQLKVEEGTAKTTVLEQAQGLIYIETDYAVIRAMGSDTEYVMCHNVQLTCIVALRGEVEVEAQNAVVTLDGGESSYVLAGQPPTPPICADLAQIDQWLDQKRGTEDVQGLGAIVDEWARNPCPATASVVTATGATTASTSTAMEPAIAATDPTATIPATPAAITAVAGSSTLPPILGLYALNPIDDAEYVYVPGGEFTMGADAGDGISILEQPQHTASTEAFWIQRTEVTNEQYGLCVITGFCTPPANENWGDPALANHPVTHVSWQQANEYARWSGGRLPTEAEWEKACRHPDERIYAWGNEPPTNEVANFGEAVGDTTPVGSYPAGASANGALDINGNVWEWTASLEQGYPYQADDDREAPEGEGERIARGGSFYYTRYQLTCTSRFGLPPDNTYEYVGFRVVISPATHQLEFVPREAD